MLLLVAAARSLRARLWGIRAGGDAVPRHAALGLAGADVQVWRREDAVAADGTIRQTPGERLNAQTLPARSGVVMWTPPAGAGEYIAAIAPAWTEACMTGTGYTSLRLGLT